METTTSKQVKVKRCSRPGCTVQIQPGQLACKEHWYALTPKLRDRLVFAWEERKKHPDIPELVNIHRALLLEALKEWGFTTEQIRDAIRTGAPKAIQTGCPFCGLPGGLHRVGCQKLQ
jgi:hypothetical protein